MKLHHDARLYASPSKPSRVYGIPYCGICTHHSEGVVFNRSVSVTEELPKEFFEGTLAHCKRCLRIKRLEKGDEHMEKHGYPLVGSLRRGENQQDD